MLGDSKLDRDLFRIVVGSTSIAFGVLLAGLASFPEFRASGTISFGWRPIVGFLVGALGNAYFWIRLREKYRKRDSAPK